MRRLSPQRSSLGSCAARLLILPLCNSMHLFSRLWLCCTLHPSLCAQCRPAPRVPAPVLLTTLKTVEICSIPVVYLVTLALHGGAYVKHRSINSLEKQSILGRSYRQTPSISKAST